jgi:hypothetical protein
MTISIRAFIPCDGMSGQSARFQKPDVGFAGKPFVLHRLPHRALFTRHPLLLRRLIWSGIFSHKSVSLHNTAGIIDLIRRDCDRFNFFASCSGKWSDDAEMFFIVLPEIYLTR